MESIRRAVDQSPVTLTTSEGTSVVLDVGMFASGEVFIPSGSTITSLTYYGAPNSKGTFLPLQDTAGAAIAQTVAAAKAYPIPAGIFGCTAIKIVADHAGDIHLTFKS